MKRFTKRLLIFGFLLILLTCEAQDYPYYLNEGERMEFHKSAFYSANDYLCGLYGDGSMSSASWKFMVNLAFYAAKGKSSITLALMDHDGDWSVDGDSTSGALLNLKNYIEANTDLTINLVPVTLGTTDLSGIDLLFVTGHSFVLNDTQKAAFREYFRSYSGVMFADDCNGYEYGAFTDNFKAAVTEATGITRYQEVSAEHLLYNCYYELDGTNWIKEDENGLYGHCCNGIPIKYFQLD